ncbi:alcohol dehydrogenase [[Emmonsia] crescens]|uniref:Alcohol dehydrogenase n=1 Tax=[Emmonsia] crescens TaxID=73230 RepID=A0A0G2HPR6_9EURO|nr:alcohol dehydrogenase [Emmonsia crescens UAMH 3008]
MAVQVDLPSTLKTSVESSKAEYTQLGKSGLRASVPIFGTMSLARSKWSKWVKNEDQALPLLKMVYDRGINSCDTAGLYSNGTAEEMVGKAIKKYDIPRHKVAIMTKCWAPVSEHDDVFVLTYWGELSKSKYQKLMGPKDLSRPAIFNSIEAYLKRMGTDYLDLLIMHRVDPSAPIKETMEAFHHLIKSGKVSKLLLMERRGRQGYTMSQVALVWLSKRIACPVLGLSSSERMDEALAIRGQNLSEAEEQYLEEAYKPRALVGHG